MIVTPYERLSKVDLPELQEDYRNGFDVTAFQAEQEIDFFYSQSRLNSVNHFARIAGLSKDAVNRLRSRKGIPLLKYYQPARERLIHLFGHPQIRLEQLHSEKRQNAVKVVLEKTGFKQQVKAKRQPPRNLEFVVSSLATKIWPPEHEQLRNAEQYSNWIDKIRESQGIDDQDIVDAAGIFLATREHLRGFVDLVLAKASSLGDDVVALQVKEDFKFLSAILVCFQDPKETDAKRKLKNAYKNLLELNPGSVAKPGITPSAFVGDLVSRWGLETRAFQSNHSSIGYLLMESDITRSRVLDVLTRGKTEWERSNA